MPPQYYERAEAAGVVAAFSEFTESSGRGGFAGRHWHARDWDRCGCRTRAVFCWCSLLQRVGKTPEAADAYDVASAGPETLR